MKAIKLVNSNKLAVVDDEYFEWLNKYKWYLSHHGYAILDRFASTEEHMFLSMHLNIWWKHHRHFTPSLVLDHIDRIKLNNRLENLREVTHQENVRNSTHIVMKHDPLYKELKAKAKLRKIIEREQAKTHTDPRTR